MTAEGVIKLQKFILTSFFVILSVLLQSIVLNARSATESFADLVEDVLFGCEHNDNDKSCSSEFQGCCAEGSPFEEPFRDFQSPNSPRQRPRNANALGSGCHWQRWVYRD